MLSARSLAGIGKAGRRLLLALSLTILTVSICSAQGSAANSRAAQNDNQNPLSNRELLESFGRVAQKLQASVKLPEPRSESRLLPLLPSDTVFFAAIPNYGNAAQQALNLFQQELKSDATLRDWWNSRDMAKNGPKIVDALDQFYRLHQFVGDEIMLTGSFPGNEPKFVAFAEIRKPGLDKFLAEVIQNYGGVTQAGVRVVGPQELATLAQKDNRKDLLVVVRPDFVLVSEDPEALRSFSASLAHGNKEFLSTPFGARVAREYQDGVTLLAAANLESAIKKIPEPDRQKPEFQESGFADSKYLVWDHKRIEGKDISQSELSFNGPRHGIAAWLANPGPLNTLDFASPDAMFAMTLRLVNPPNILDEIVEISRPSPGSPLSAISHSEQALGFSVRDDLLGSLGGEITIELDEIGTRNLTGRAIFSVKDVPRLQKTLNSLLAATQIKVDQTDADGITYNALRLPPSSTPNEIGYAFLDNFLVIGSGKQAIPQSAKLHRTGGSLLKSEKLRAAAPPGHNNGEASALWCQNAKAMAAFQMQRLAPDLAASLTSALNDAPPVVAYAYGEESSIKTASSNNYLDAGAVLVIAAVAIPNLIKSKAAANESSAVGSLRTITTAQITYATAYPKKGFSPNLARLGPGPNVGAPDSPFHANLVDASLGGTSCTGDAWCARNGYQFRVTATCTEGNCTHFLAVAKPQNTSSGVRSFCVTDDGVIHYQLSAETADRFTIAECRKWQALQ